MFKGPISTLPLSEVVNEWLKTVAAIFLVTAFAKLVSQGGSMPILAFPDPVLGLPNKQVLQATGMAELIAAGYVAFSKNTNAKCILTLWLSGCFVLYRLALWWIAPGRPCPCLGVLGSWLPVSQVTLDWILKGLVVYLVAGSLWFLRSDHQKAVQLEID